MVRQQWRKASPSIDCCGEHEAASFIAQRSIHYMLHIIGIDALVVSKALLSSAASGRKHYFEYLGGAKEQGSKGDMWHKEASCGFERKAKLTKTSQDHQSPQAIWYP